MGKFLYTLFIHIFISFLLALLLPAFFASVVVLLSSNRPIAHGPEFRDPPPVHMMRNVREYVNYLESRRSAAMRKSGVALKILDLNNITGSLLLGHWSSNGCIAEVKVSQPLIVLDLMLICRSFVATRK